MSVPYPMSVSSVSLDHKGGTKSYHLLMVTNAQGKACVVTRWGKRGVFGQFDVAQFSSIREAESFFEKKFREKSTGGYGPVTPVQEKQVIDADELKAALGRMTLAPVFGPENYSFLDSDFDVSGIRTAAKGAVFKDGGLVDDGVKRFDPAEFQRLAEQERAEKERAEQEQLASQLSSLPTFGMF